MRNSTFDCVQSADDASELKIKPVDLPSTFLPIRFYGSNHQMFRGKNVYSSKDQLPKKLNFCTAGNRCALVDDKSMKQVFFLIPAKS